MYFSYVDVCAILSDDRINNRAVNDKFPWIRGKCDFPKNTTLLLLLF